jgi:hypothetical protein
VAGRFSWENGGLYAPLFELKSSSIFTKHEKNIFMADAD